VGDGEWAQFTTRHGSAPARTASSRPSIRWESAAEAAAAVSSAPDALEAMQLSLATRSHTNAPGFGFARSSDGAAWRVTLQQVEGASSVLDRVAWIEATRVPTAADGGQLPDPVTRRGEALLVPERFAELRRVLLAIPGASSTAGQILQGTYDVFESPPREFRIEAFHRRLAFPETFSSFATAGPWVGLLLERGMAEAARLNLEHHGSTLVRGDADGFVSVRDHASLVIEGDLLGTAEVDFHAVLLVEGDVVGTLRLRGHARAFVRGRLLGVLDLSAANHANLVLAGTWNREDVLRLPTPGDQCRLHVRSSDLGPGEHTDVGAWQAVVVGGDLWDALGR
jgi:hypothetical protein